MSERCIICGWTLATRPENGCMPGDCAYRPDDPAEQERLKNRREIVKRAQDAVIAGWEKCADVPFPLYDREAREIAVSVMQAIGY